MVEAHYKKITRIVEYYIFISFIIIAIILPFLMDYSWIDPVIRIIYFTAFPLLLLLLIVSLVKDALLQFLKRRLEPEEKQPKSARRKPK